MAKSLVEQIVEVYPELADNDYDLLAKGIVRVQDDSDGQGAYIAAWSYSKPIPDGMKLGK
jgi:hypothetical protein